MYSIVASFALSIFLLSGCAGDSSLKLAVKPSPVDIHIVLHPDCGEPGFICRAALLLLNFRQDSPPVLAETFERWLKNEQEQWQIEAVWGRGRSANSAACRSAAGVAAELKKRGFQFIDERSYLCPQGDRHEVAVIMRRRQ